MSDTPKSSRWNSILEAFGLPTPPPPESPAEPPPPRPATPPPSREKAAPKAKAPAKPPRNWSAIAGDLGLDVPPEPAAPPVASPTPAPPPAQVPPTRQRPAAERSSPPRSRPAEPTDFGASPGGRSPLDDIFGEKEGDVDVFGLSGGRELRRPVAPQPAVPPGSPPALDDEEEDGPILDYDLDSEGDLLLDDEPAVRSPGEEDEIEEGRQARGSGSSRGEQRGDERVGDRERGRRRRRRGRGRGSRRDEPPADARSGAAGEAMPRSRAPDKNEIADDDELLPAPAELDDVFGDQDDLEQELPSRAAPSPTERESAGERGDDRGHRRGRGRSRGRGREQRAPEQRGRDGRSREGRRDDRPRRERGGVARGSESIPEGRSSERLPPRDVRPPDEDLLDVGDEDDLDFPLPPASARPASAAAAPPPEGFDDALAVDEHEDEGELGHTGHKKIPTWQDAVGILIDANMAARANSPDRGHRGRRGSGRGR